MNIRNAILLLVGSFLLVVIIRFPAAVVFAHVTTAPMVIHNPGGSIWNGNSPHVRVGQHELAYVEEVDWSLNPTALFGGKLGADVSFKALGGTGTATVARAFNGDVFVTDGDLNINAQSIDALIPGQLAKLGGRWQVLIEDAHFTPQQPESLRGELIWSNAQLNSPLQANLGTVTVTITPNPTPDSGGHRVQIKNADGVLQIAGNIEVDKGGDYRVDIRLIPKPGASADLEGTLGLLGQRGSDGSYRLRQNGRLHDLL